MVNKKDIPEKPQGVASIPPVPARVKVLRVEKTAKKPGYLRKAFSDKNCMI